MSSCAKQSFNNFTPAAWNCLVEKAAQYGVEISSNSGSAGASGFKLAWNYNPGASTLEIQCTDKPFFVSCSQVNSKINDVVEGCMGSGGAEVSPMLDD